MSLRLLAVNTARLEFELGDGQTGEPDSAPASLQVIPQPQDNDGLLQFKIHFVIAPETAQNQMMFRFHIDLFASYAIDGDLEGVDLEAFGLSTALADSFPFLREIVLSTTAASGIAPWVLPVPAREAVDSQLHAATGSTGGDLSKD